MRVLLIETDANLCRVLTEMLEWMGHTVKACAVTEVAQLQSGEGLEGVDVLIVHHASPGLDKRQEPAGFNPSLWHVPVVMIVNGTDTDLSPQLPLQAGAIMLRQPVSVGSMRNALQRVLTER